MNRRLQDFEFYASAYDRPNQKWVCGWASEGRPCRIGPDKKGHCRATYECSPRLRGERWHCTRSKQYGGDCSGPLPDGTCGQSVPPCQPVRSLQAKRGLVVFWSIAATLAIILIFLGGSALEAPRRVLIEPGALTVQHGAQNCDSCHQAMAATNSPFQWIDMAVSARTPGLDSRRCWHCHKELGEQALLPHGLSIEKVASITEEIRTQAPTHTTPWWLAATSAVGIGAPQNSKGELACAACHREHQGRLIDLSAMSELACQTCHLEQFEDFHDGHPEFISYPYKRRPRIVFDHTSHKGYLNNELTPFLCTVCHTKDEEGVYMLAGNFEATCTSCHLEELREQTISFFTLPAVRLQRLENLNIGQWPADERINDAYKGNLTPFMILLLAGDENYPEFEDDFQTWLGLDLKDLSDAEAGELEAVGRMLWAIKKLMLDLVEEGHQATKTRLERIVGQPLKHEALAALNGQVPIDLIKTAQIVWFPNLKKEFADYEAAKRRRSPTKTHVVRAKASEGNWGNTGGWYRQENEDFSLVYRPVGHQDVFLKNWLELTNQYYGQINLRALWETLTDPEVGGTTCIKCHSVEAKPQVAGSGDAAEGNPPEIRMINWKYDRSVPDSFTHFSHEPHLHQGCGECHIANVDFTSQQFLADYKSLDPAMFTGHYDSMSKGQCTSCHAPDKADQNCLNCHTYHVGEE